MIELEKSEGVWVIRLNRPDKANALTESMLQELLKIAKAADGARALVLTGRGNVFSAGADLDAARAGLARSPLWEELSAQIAALPCLTVAALNGALAGGAFGMALACDIRIAVPSAKFFYPVMKHGFLPQPSDPIRMRALIGPSRTKLVFLAGQKLSAAEALDFGLIDRIVEADRLSETAFELVGDFAAAKPETAEAIKRMCTSDSVSSSG